MARTVNQEEYAAKRHKILNVVEQLIITKGYEQMSIQDILDLLQISRGALFHYYGSKHELLEALIEQMLEDLEMLLIPIVSDPNLSAINKLQRFFDTVVQRKTEQKPLLFSLLHTWYSDSNALVREKIRMAKAQRFTPLLTKIIHQGLEEGVVATPYPGHISEAIFFLIFDFSETFSRLLLSATPEDLLRVENSVAMYTDAIERILGIPSQSLHLIDAEALKEWMS